MKYELLAPAGDLECLKWAIEAGANAIYLGGSRFGARAYSKNFTDEELVEAINYAHLYGVKVYLTCNTIIYDDETESFIDFVRFAYKNGIDAVLIQDLGMLDLVRKKFPDLEIHASTQMHIHNLEGAMMAKKLGIKRIVLARETPISVIEEIKRKTALDIEVFVHGSLCVSYSGQCLFSSMVGKRSGNRGCCAGSCRLPYQILDKNGKILNQEKSYPLSMKDLCAISSLDKLMQIGVNSFKIEGRMKSKEYVYLVTKLYRKAIDSYLTTGKIVIDYQILNDLKKVFNRKYTAGFLNNAENSDVINGLQPNNVGVKIGQVIKLNKNKIDIKLQDDIHINDGLRIKGKAGEIGAIVNEFYINNKLVKAASKGDIITLPVKTMPKLFDDVYLTSSKYIENSIEEYIKNNPCKVDIKIDFQAKIDQPLSLKISDFENTIEIKGEICQQATKIPTSLDTIREKLEKIKDTVYKVVDLNIKADENIFIPLAVLNNMRRCVITKLNEKRTANNKEFKEYDYTIKLPNFKKEQTLNLFCDCDETVKNYHGDLTKFKYIYSLDLPTKYIHSFPNVVDSYQNIKSLSPVLVGEIGGLSLISNATKIHTDYSFNVVNSYTVAFLHSLGVEKITLSYELTKEQIQNLIASYENRYHVLPNLEVITYGYIKIMTMKYNLQKDYQDEITIQDRFQNIYKTDNINDLTEVYYPKILDNRIIDYYTIGINHIRYNLYKFK